MLTTMGLACLKIMVKSRFMLWNPGLRTKRLSQANRSIPYLPVLRTCHKSLWKFHIQPVGPLQFKLGKHLFSKSLSLKKKKKKKVLHCSSLSTPSCSRISSFWKVLWYSKGTYLATLKTSGNYSVMWIYIFLTQIPILNVFHETVSEFQRKYKPYASFQWKRISPATVGQIIHQQTMVWVNFVYSQLVQEFVVDCTWLTMVWNRRDAMNISRVVRERVSVMASHTMSGQHSQPARTSMGLGCMLF